MLSILPTYPSYKNFPIFLQGGQIPYIFAQTDRKMPSFLYTDVLVQGITVTDATLIELDYNSLRTYKEYKVIAETAIDLANIGTKQGYNFFQVYGKPNAIILAQDKIYTIKIQLINNSEFYTGMFIYCLENQANDGFLWYVNGDSDYLIDGDNTNILID